jgi:hypothetical protein
MIYLSTNNLTLHFQSRQYMIFRCVYLTLTLERQQQLGTEVNEPELQIR